MPTDLYLDSGNASQPFAAGLCPHQGGHPGLHARAGQIGSGAGDLRELRGTRPGVDTAATHRRPARRQDPGLRLRDANEATWAAGRDGAAVCAASFAGVDLCHRRSYGWTGRYRLVINDLPRKYISLSSSKYLLADAFGNNEILSGIDRSEVSRPPAKVNTVDSQACCRIKSAKVIELERNGLFRSMFTPLSVVYKFVRKAELRPSCLHRRYRFVTE